MPCCFFSLWRTLTNTHRYELWYVKNGKEEESGTAVSDLLSAIICNQPISFSLLSDSSFRRLAGIRRNKASSHAQTHAVEHIPSNSLG